MFSRRLLLWLSRWLIAFSGSVLLIVSGDILVTGSAGTSLFPLALCMHLVAQTLCIVAICWPGGRRRGSGPFGAEPAPSESAFTEQGANGARRETGERAAQFHPGTQTIRLLYGSVLLSALFALLIVGIVQARNLTMLRTTGLATNGTILGTNYREGVPQMTVTYSFIVPGGPPIADSFRVSRSRITEMRTGNALTVTYVPLQPDIHTWQTVDNGYVVRQIGSGVGIFAVVMVYLLAPITLIEGRLRRQLRLARTGQAVTGTIEACKPVILFGRRLGYELIYSFGLPSGEKMGGRAMLPPVAGEPTLPGFPITVLVDPDRVWLHRPLAALNAVAISNLRRGVLMGG